MLSEYDAPKQARRPRVGDEVTAKVVVVGSDAVFVDLGTKTEGVIEHDQLRNADGELTVEVGDTITARVASTSGGTIVLRTRAARGPDAGSELQAAASSGLAVEGTVSAVNKGGVEVDIGGVRAFCPISQLDLRYVEDPGSYMGKKLTFRVTRFEAAQGGGKPNVVISRRALLEEENKKRAAETRAGLEVGAVVSGTVTSVKDYGAFVDLGGLDGMLHITELGFGRVDHPKDVLSVGDLVRVQVTKIEETDDPKRPERIGLSLKALQTDPWETVTAKLKEGQRLTGEVVRLESFGAFVSIDQNIEGLVHVSELGANRHVHHARDVLSMGQKVEVLVKGIDHERKRIALSMKDVGAQKEAEQAASFKPTGGSLGTFADLFNKKK